MIGNRLREERLRLEMSQDAFSQHCGVTKNTQVSYEKGRRSPDTTYLLKAIEIGVDVLYVVTGRHVPAAVKALTQEQLDILNYMSGMSEQNRADLVRVEGQCMTPTSFEGWRLQTPCLNFGRPFVKSLVARASDSEISFGNLDQYEVQCVKESDRYRQAGQTTLQRSPPDCTGYWC